MDFCSETKVGKYFVERLKGRKVGGLKGRKVEGLKGRKVGGLKGGRVKGWRNGLRYYSLLRKR